MNDNSFNSKKKIFDTRDSNPRLSSHSSQRDAFSKKESPLGFINKNKENDDSMTSSSGLADLRPPRQDFPLPPTYKQDKAMLKKLQEKDKPPPKNTFFEGHPAQEDMDESQQFRIKEMDILRRKNQDLDRENTHLKKKLAGLEEKMQRGFDQEKDIIDKLANVPPGDAYKKIRELMKEVHYWQDRFSKAEIQLDELREYPRKIEDLESKLEESNADRQKLRKDLKDALDKLNALNQQKARVEGELVGKGAQISKLNELETEKNNLKIELEDWKNKFNNLNAKFQDKDSLVGKHEKLKQLLEDRESRLKSMTSEIQRLNELLLEKKSENDKLRGRTTRLDEIQLMYQKEREFRENEIRALKARLGEDGSPKKKMKNAKREYEQKIEALKNELARTIEDRKAKVLENENLKKDIGDLHVELSLKDDLKEELEDKDKRIRTTLEEVNRLNEVLGSQVSAYENSQKKLEEYENKIIMLTTEIQRLNQMLRTKNEENDMMKLRFGEMDSKMQAQREKFDEKIKGLTKDLENARSKLRTAEATKALEINSLKVKLDDFKKTEQELKEEQENLTQKTKVEPLENIKRKMKKELLHLDEQNRILKEDNEHIKRQADLWKEELEKIEEELELGEGERVKRGGRGATKGGLLKQIEDMNQELERVRLENNDLRARINYMAETEELNQKKIQDLLRLYEQAKNAHQQHFSEMDSLHKTHSEHMMARGNLERDLQNLERINENLKYRLATMELEYKALIQKMESEWGAKLKFLENESNAKINQLEQYRIEYDRIALEMKAREKIDQTFDARVNEYEEKVAFFAGECEKLKLIIFDKDEEIQEVKAKLSEIENLEKQDLQENLLRIKQMLEIKLNELDSAILQKQQLERQLEESRDLEDNLRKLRDIIDQKDLEIRQLTENSGRTAELLREKDLLESELTKLSRILENKIEENEDWKEKFQRLEGLLSEKGGLEARFMDNEDKQRRMMAEMERLARESKQKSQENEQLLRKIRSLEIAMNDSINLQNEIIRLKNILEEKLEEIDSWKSKCSRLEAIIGDKESLEGRALEYERKIDVLVKDIEKLGYVYRGKSRENEELKQLLAMSEARISDRSVLESEVRKMKEILEGKLQEIDNLKARNSALELAIANKDGFMIKSREYEEKIRMLSGELEKVSLILRDKNEEIEGWRVRFTKQENSLRDRESLEAEIKKMRGFLEAKLQEIEDLKALNVKQEMKIAGCQELEGKLSEFQRKMEYLHRELERLTGVLRNKQEENEDLRLKCNRYETMIRDEEVLSGEFAKMKEILERKLCEIEDHKSRCSQYELRLADQANQSEQQRDCERKLDLLTRELEKLSMVLKEKMEEIEDWRVKYSRLESAQRDSLSLQEEIRRLSEILQGKLMEIDEWRSRYAKLEVYLAEHSGNIEKFEDYERKIEKLAQEIERLGGVLQEKMKENEDLRVRIQRLETQMRDNEVLEKELRNMKEILGGKLLENDDLRANCSKLEYLINEKGNYDGKLREYEDKISLLANELEKLSRILSEKMEENEELKVILTKELGGNRDKDFMNGEIGRLKEVLAGKLAENDDLRARLGQISALKNELVSKDKEIAALTQDLNHLVNGVIPEKNLIIEQLRQQILEKDNLAQQNLLTLKELEKLQEILKEKMKEIESLKNIIANYNKTKAQEIDNLSKILEMKRLAHVETNAKANSSQIEEIKIKVKEALLEAETWRDRCEKLERLVKELEGSDQEKNQEIERLNILLSERTEEIEILKRDHLAEKEALLGENEQLKRDLAALREENEKLKHDLAAHESLLALIETMKRDLDRLREENQHLRKELDHNLQDQEKLRQDLENSVLSDDNFKDLERKLRELRQEIEFKNRELEEWKRKYKELERQVQLGQPKLFGPGPSPKDSENERLKFDIKNLEELLNERTKDMNEVKGILEPIQAENVKLRGTVDALAKENEELKAKLFNPRMEGQLRESGLFEEENKKLKRLLSERIFDIDRLKERLDESESMVRRGQDEIERMKRGMLEVGELYRKDVGAFERKNKDLERELSVLKGLMKEAEGAIKSKNDENQDLKNMIKSDTFNTQTERFKQEIAAKQKRIEELEAKKMDHELEVLSLRNYESRNNEYQRTFMAMNDQIQELKNEIFRKETEISKLRERIMELERGTLMSSTRKRGDFEEAKGLSEKKKALPNPFKDASRWMIEDDKMFERPHGFDEKY